jgi:hypothetical protein
MDDLIYKTPSPVMAKRRLSGIPVKITPVRGDGIFSEQIPRMKDYHEFNESKSKRRNSIGNASAILKGMEAEDSASVDSSMGFRELEKVLTLAGQGLKV